MFLIFGRLACHTRIGSDIYLYIKMEIIYGVIFAKLVTILEGCCDRYGSRIACNDTMYHMRRGFDFVGSLRHRGGGGQPTIFCDKKNHLTE